MNNQFLDKLRLIANMHASECRAAFQQIEHFRDLGNVSMINAGMRWQRLSHRRYAAALKRYQQFERELNR